jgi:LuxR family maltose regulon positive regulatory protein
MGPVARAEVLIEWNDAVGAAHAATQGIELLRGTVERLMLVRGYIVLALVYQAQADHHAALESIRRCEAWFEQTPIGATGPARAWLAACQARLWVRQGDLTAAAQWAQDCTRAGDSELGYIQQLTLVRLRLAQSHNDIGGRLLGEASAILAQLLPAVAAREWTRYSIEGLVLQALVCQAQADRTNALAALERALTLAEPEGYVRTFVDEGAPMAALLRAADRHGIAPAYAARLLAAFPSDELRVTSDELRQTSPPVTRHASLVTLVEPLSEREREVLALIHVGLSNQEIADKLIIAQSTVKKHVNNIFGKLGTQSRTQALARARELGLL